MKTIAAVIGLSCLAIPAHGGHCVQQFRGHHYGGYHAVKAFVVAPYYQVGSALREEAIAKRAAEEALKANDAQWQAKFQQLKADLFKFQGQGTFTINGEAAAGGDVAVGDAAGAAMPDTVATALTRSCVDCHGPTKQSGGLDLTKAIADPRIAAEIGMRVVTDDAELRMPPSGTIEAADRQAIFDYSVSVSKGLRKAAGQ